MPDANFSGSIEVTKILVSLLLACLLWPTAARADRWMPPQTSAHLSPDGSHRLTIQPGSYREESPRAEAVMERRDGRVFRVLWRLPLTHPLAPAEVLVANDGRFATLDNWGSVGTGDNVVAIHAADGRLVRMYSLAALLGDARAATLPRSVSSVWWRRTQRIDPEGVLVLAIADDRHPAEIRIDMSSGELIPTEAEPGPAATPRLPASRDLR